MERAISETNRRRQLQIDYNRKMGITPKTIQKSVHDTLETLKVAEDSAGFRVDIAGETYEDMPFDELINKLTAEMKQAAKLLEFERAAALRDQIESLRKKQGRNKH